MRKSRVPYQICNEVFTSFLRSVCCRYSEEQTQVPIIIFQLTIKLQGLHFERSRFLAGIVVLYGEEIKKQNERSCTSCYLTKKAPLGPNTNLTITEASPDVDLNIMHHGAHAILRIIPLVHPPPNSLAPLVPQGER